MKKFLSMFLVLAIVVCMGITAFAADESREYLLELSANTASEIKAQPGDVITLTVALKQVKSDGGDNIIYAMQDEIRYDDEFVEVMDEMMLTANNIRTADVELMGGDKAFYINFLSMEKGTSWPQNAMLATFQVKVLGEHGATKLKNENVKISTKDGSASYVCAVQDVTIIVSEDCTIFFDSKGGSDVESIRVDIGKTNPQPEDPVKEG